MKRKILCQQCSYCKNPVYEDDSYWDARGGYYDSWGIMHYSCWRKHIYPESTIADDERFDPGTPYDERLAILRLARGVR